MLNDKNTELYLKAFQSIKMMNDGGAKKNSGSHNI